MNSLDRISNSIDEAVTTFGKKTPALERRLMELLDATVKELEVKNGRILSNVSNLKKINDIKRKLGKIILNNDYLKQVKSFTQAFDRVSELQNDYLSEFNRKFTPAKTASVIQTMAIDSTIDSLTESGINSAVSKPILDMLKTSVVSGGSYSDLASQLRSSIISSDGKQSILDRHISTVAADALNTFSGQSLKLLTDDLGFEWYRYVGSNKTTSRELCKYLIEKQWIHISEFDDIIRGHIDNHVCELNPKTKLPKGMIDGTNANNFIVNRGGWNCQHKLIPVPKEIVPNAIRIRFDKKEAAKSTRNYLENDVFEKIKVDGVVAGRAVYKVSGYEDSLIFNKKTIDKFLSRHHGADDYYDRIGILRNMASVLKTAKYKYTEKPRNESHKGEVFDIFEISYNGKIFELQCKKNRDGCFIYFVK